MVVFPRHVTDKSPLTTLAYWTYPVSGFVSSPIFRPGPKTAEEQDNQDMVGPEAGDLLHVSAEKIKEAAPEGNWEWLYFYLSYRASRKRESCDPYAPSF